MKLWTIIGPAGLALLASAVPAGTAAPTAAAAPAPAHAVRITNSPRPFLDYDWGAGGVVDP